MDEVLASALVRKPEPIHWDEAAQPVQTRSTPGGRGRLRSDRALSGAIIESSHGGAFRRRRLLLTPD